MNSEAPRLAIRAIIKPQNRRVLLPLMLSASLRPLMAATMGDVRDSPCQMKVKVRATKPLAPKIDVPNPDMMK